MDNHDRSDGGIAVVSQFGVTIQCYSVTATGLLLLLGFDAVSKKVFGPLFPPLRDRSTGPFVASWTDNQKLK